MCKATVQIIMKPYFCKYLGLVAEICLEDVLDFNVFMFRLIIFNKTLYNKSFKLIHIS